MAIFGVETRNNKVDESFIIETNKRLNSLDMTRNPFRGYAKIISKEDNLISVIKMVPLWPNFGPWIGLFSFLPILMFGWYSAPLILLFPLTFMSMAFFWSEHFFLIMFKAGLKKHGYKGNIKRIKKDDLIDLLAERTK